MKHTTKLFILFIIFSNKIMGQNASSDNCDCIPSIPPSCQEPCRHKLELRIFNTASKKELKDMANFDDGLAEKIPNIRRELKSNSTRDFRIDSSSFTIDQFDQKLNSSEKTEIHRYINSLSPKQINYFYKPIKVRRAEIK